MTRVPTGNAAAAPAVVTRYITDDIQREAIKADPELTLCLLDIGDHVVTQFAAGNPVKMADLNTVFADRLPMAATHFKKGKKAGLARPTKIVNAENANKAAALFRRAKTRYGQSNLLDAIQALDTALGGSTTRITTVVINVDKVATATLTVAPKTA